MEDDAPCNRSLLLLRHICSLRSLIVRDYVTAPLAMCIPLAKSETVGGGETGGN